MINHLGFLMQHYVIHPLIFLSQSFWSAALASDCCNEAPWTFWGIKGLFHLRSCSSSSRWASHLNHQENAQGLVHRPMWWGYFLNWGSHFPYDLAHVALAENWPSEVLTHTLWLKDTEHLSLRFVLAAVFHLLLRIFAQVEVRSKAASQKL